MSAPLSDEGLTQDGLSALKGASILVLACGALAREILAVLKANKLDHVDLQCLPAILHNTPDKIPDAVRAAVADHAANYDKIFVAYADCGTGGLLQAACAELGVEMIDGPHCYSFFEGNAIFEARDEFTAFYLTDFLVRQFDAFVTKPLGLDRHPELRDMYFGNYTKLVYQAQIENPDLKALAERHAETLGLAFEYRFTGYGDLAKSLQQL
ncbi:MAG: DUF1638 domain-containing protein [Pseudomonadota bacterium]